MDPCRALIVFYLSFLCLVPPARSQQWRASSSTVTISNVKPRRDVHGQWMDAHDGLIQQWAPGGLYYYYAMSYGDCKEEPSGCFNVTVGACGFRLDHNISVFTSPDLVAWTYASNALPVDTRPPGIYYRPKVVYNPSTKLYVMWWNYVLNGNFSESRYGVATSSSPVGPFEVQNGNVATRYKIGGDFDLFVDGDDAYIIYTSLANGHDMSIERLSADFLSSAALHDPSASSGLFGQTFVEAPAMFKRNNVYYALFGRCCCFCGSGSGVGVYTAQHVLGPYMFHNNIGRVNGTGASITKAQQNCVFKVATTTGTTYLWTGDRWQSAPDHIKAHDFQFWSPLSFVGDDIKPLKWLDSFTLALP